MPKKSKQPTQSHSTLLPMATSVSKRTRAITWTLFNYEPYIDLLKQYAKEECEYMIFGFEVCPDTGKRHLQGYHYYSNARAYPNKKWRDLTNLEKNGRDFISNGSPKQNYDYCSKLGDFWEHGDLPKQGNRTDWEQARSHLQNGGDVITTIEEQPQLLPFIRSLERFQTLSVSKPLHRDVKVIILIGDSGTGKTRYAYDNYPDLYSKPEGAWWDSYKGEKTILLDDYYGDIPYSQFLKVLDRYPLQVPQKGTHIYAQWDTVIITSNKQPEHWYAQGYTDALKRRTKILIRDYTHATRPEDQDEEACTPQDEPPRRSSPDTA